MGSSLKDEEKVKVHYNDCLVVKQGWQFDSTYNYKDLFNNLEPYVFIVGDRSV
jgi:hypothetical protein